MEYVRLGIAVIHVPGANQPQPSPWILFPTLITLSAWLVVLIDPRLLIKGLHRQLLMPHGPS